MTEVTKKCKGTVRMSIPIMTITLPPRSQRDESKDEWASTIKDTLRKAGSEDCKGLSAAETANKMNCKRTAEGFTTSVGDGDTAKQR
jgi:hypothetical protein